MKKMKKILAFVMAMAMVLGMSVTSLASSVPDPNPTRDTKPANGTKDDFGRIAISGVAANTTAGKDITVTAYKIIEAKYANNKPAGGNDYSGKFSGYADVYSGNGVPVFVENGKYVDSNISEANLAAVRAYIEKNPTQVKPENVKNMTEKTEGSGVYENENVPIGTYLVVISGAEGKIYSNIVVSVQYVNKDGTTEQIESTELYIHSGLAYTKVQDNPTVDKKIVEGNNKVSGNSANVSENDELSFEIVADIPTYSGKNPVYKITDTLTGLKLKANSIKIEVKDKDTGDIVASTDATLNKPTVEYENESVAESNNLVLNFVKTTKSGEATVKNYTLKEYGGKKLVITYTAYIDKDTAQYNAVPNTNSVVLEYTHNSNVDSAEEKGTTPEKTTKTYTFDLSGTVSGSNTESFLTKTGEIDKTASDAVTLPGAVFKLYQKEANGTEKNYTNDVMSTKYTAKDGTEVTSTTAVVTSGANGELIIRGLATGTYYLKEIVAPPEYSLSDHEYTIVVNPTIDTNGELTSCDVTVDGAPLFTINGGDNASVSGDIPANGKIPNTKLSSLPSTGGIGTTIFTIGGCAIMIVAAGLFFASRRKSSK